MGNNPSKTSSGGSTSPVAGTHSPATSALDKKVDRRKSIQKLPGGKGTAADPSSSNAIATAQNISGPNQQPHLQQHLQSSPSPDSAARRYQTQHARDSSKSEQKEVATHPKDVPHEPAEPMQVPLGPDRSSAKSEQHPFVEPSGPPLNPYYTPSSQLQRPPRLPLPIGEEVFSPGSPIIGPTDLNNDAELNFDDLESTIPRKSSTLSSTTADDDELGDELQPYEVDGVVKTVPTLIEWKQSGEKVYVTGTFAGWNRKFRLHKSASRDGLSVLLQLPPGTHHVKFIIDGDMRASDNLPTAVDYTNVLVNYIEVSADDIPRPRRESDRTKIPTVVPPGVYPPQVLPEADEYDYASESAPGSQEASEAEEEKEAEEVEVEVPTKNFQTTIPQFLIDVDKDEDTNDYQQAANLIGETPPPPSLPLFLGKSILNGTTPMKDDSSVLNYPNHTVLNHLATSSIKNGVLATSATTRYKRKYVTTVMYKPTVEVSE